MWKISIQINTRENIWNKTFFPIIAEGGGLYILYNINKKNKEGGALYIYAPSLLLSDIPQGIYDSLEAFFLTQISCYENKKYIINNYNELDIYYDLLSQVSHRINSNSEYWKE